MMNTSRISNTLIAIVLISITLLLTVSFIPLPAQAAGLVPCGGAGEPECNICFLAQLAQNVIEFIVTISFVISALLFAYAGYLFFTGGSNPSDITKAKGIFTNTFIGIVIILTSWLVVDILLKTLTGQGVNPFTAVLCEVAEAPRQSSGAGAQSSSGVAVTGTAPSQAPTGEIQSSTGSFRILSPADIQAKVKDVNPYTSTNCVYAQQAGLSSGDCTATLAIMALESGGNAQAQKDSSFGLMQMKVDTAKGLDPALAKLSDAEVQNILLTNTDKNIELGNKYYAQQLTKYGDETLALAAYNGGATANDPSKDCSGLRRWQCPWDSQGCYGTSRTDCKVNTGYQETRAYVQNVAALRTQLGK